MPWTEAPGNRVDVEVAGADGTQGLDFLVSGIGRKGNSDGILVAIESDEECGILAPG